MTTPARKAAEQIEQETCGPFSSTKNVRRIFSIERIISACYAEREKAIADAASHLRVALAQALDSDDQIIMGHVRDALKLIDEGSK